MKGRRARDELKEVHREWRASENRREKSERGVSSRLQRPPLSGHHYGTSPNVRSQPHLRAGADTCARLAKARADRWSDCITQWRTNAQRRVIDAPREPERIMRARGRHAGHSGSLLLRFTLFCSKNTEQQMPTDNTEDGILMSNMLTKLSRSVPHSTTKCPTA